MKSARAFLVLALLLASGCLAQTYPGVVVGNPRRTNRRRRKAGEITPEDYPDPSQGPALSDPEAHDGDPSAPGPSRKIRRKPRRTRTARKFPAATAWAKLRTKSPLPPRPDPNTPNLTRPIPAEFCFKDAFPVFI
jgi:hypothetical protein